jgi:hypothetical protein
MGEEAVVAVEVVEKWTGKHCPLFHNLARDFSRHCQKGQTGGDIFAEMLR